MFVTIGLQGFVDLSVSVFHLAIRVLRLQTCTSLGCAWVLKLELHHACMASIFLMEPSA